MRCARRRPALAGAVEGDADGVEADLGVARDGRGARPSRRWRGGGRGAACARSTARTGRSGPNAAPCAAGLDLDEDEGAAVAGDDVELAVAGAGVALEDLPAGGGEAAGDELLGAARRFCWRAMRSSSADQVPRTRTKSPHLLAQRICNLRATRATPLPSVAAVLATARTFTLDGISARPVRVEVDVHRGLPGFAIVGLPDAAVREARERVRAALVNCGFEFPLRRIVVNLAPASLRKAGPGMDLAIAAALLSASGQLEWEGLSRVALAGELALDGSTRPIHGALAIAEAAREGGRGGDRACRPRTAPRRRWPRGSRWSPLDEPRPAAGAGRRRVGAAATGSRCRCGSAPPPAAPTSPTCAASRTCATRSRSPPPAATAC